MKRKVKKHFTMLCIQDVNKEMTNTFHISRNTVHKYVHLLPVG